MQFDHERVRANAEQASTEDLLDRVTMYREGMEPDALPILEEELKSRGVANDEIRAHAEARRLVGTIDAGGFPAKCSRCRRPATVRLAHWHRLWGVLPVLRRSVHFCEEHRPEE